MLLSVLQILPALALLRIVHASPAALSMPAMQLLESLGLSPFKMGSITRRAPIRKEDSPVYYIKLPVAASTGHFYNSLDFSAYEDPYSFKALTTTTEFPFEQVPVDFTNNGKPDQIFHWSGSTTSQQFWDKFKPSSYSSPEDNSYFSYQTADTSLKPKTTTPKPTTTTTTSTTTTPTPKLPTIEPWPPAVTKVPTKKPWVSFVKQFSSNGKPIGVYIHKSKPIIKTHKYKHPVFRHFNY